MVELAKDAANNGFALMMAELIRQNIEDHPQKQKTLDHLSGRLALVSEDSEVAITLHFQLGNLYVHSGIVGIPDITIRGSSDDIMKLSLMESVTRWHVPDPRGPNLRGVVRALAQRKLRIYGALSHLPFLIRSSELLGT